jgi:hypothetical protein
VTELADDAKESVASGLVVDELYFSATGGVCAVDLDVINSGFGRRSKAFLSTGSCATSTLARFAFAFARSAIQLG